MRYGLQAFFFITLSVFPAETLKTSAADFGKLSTENRVKTLLLIQDFEKENQSSHIDILCAAIGDASVTARVIAIEILQKHVESAVKVVPLLVIRLNADDSGCWAAAARTLAAFGAKSSDAVPALLRMMNAERKTPSRRARINLISGVRALAAIPPYGSDVKQFLKEMDSKSDPELQDAIRMALETMSEAEK